MDVYALGDPRTQQIHYIGVTKNVYRRYAQHLNDEIYANDGKNAWMEGIKKAGTVPTLAILESNVAGSKAREREQYWIQYYLDQGAPLSNIQHGSPKRIDSEENLQSYITASVASDILSTKLGRTVSPDYIRKIRGVRSIRIHNTSKLYLKADIEAVNIRKRQKPEQKLIC